MEVNERSTGRGCRLCPRECGADRSAGETGICGAGPRVQAARAALHFWEEPCISGTRGSGTVFFTGCALRCRFCQNQEISRPARAVRERFDTLTERELSDVFLRLQDSGAHNINLVTACQYLPQVREALTMVKGEALKIPVVWNSSGYEKPDMLRQLEGLVDIYLPDFKYMDEESGRTLSGVPGYPEAAKAALAEMVRQCPQPVFDEEGMMKSGVIVRHLLLPGHVKDGKAVVRYLHETYGSRIYISLLSQYTPMKSVEKDPLLRRRVTRREYDRLVAFALEIGVTNGFTQEREVAKESFIPAFDGEGLRKEERRRETDGHED